MNKKVLIVVIVIILAVGGYFGYNTFLKPNNQTAAAETVTPKLEDLKTFDTGDPFTTNVKSSTSLCQLSATVAYSGGDKTEFLTTNKALIRSCILTAVRNHTAEELRAPDAPQTLSKEMVLALNEKLQTDVIVNVYISAYVVQ
jgi:flagellar basal body-associated protein FliL